MFGNPSLLTRIAVGKLVGFVVGLIGFVFLPDFLPDVSLLFRWGILLWYTTFGVIIGIFGVYSWHPILKIHMPWWVLSMWIGAWMNFVLVFFTYDVMHQMLVTMFGANSTFTSPFWFALEGAIVGLIIGYFATQFGGYGKETVTEMPD